MHEPNKIYYIIKDSLDPKIVGSAYPQAYDFIKGYNPEAPDAIFTMYDYRTSFPDFEPDLDGIKLSGKAKLTDFISNSFDGFIVSPNVKLIMEKYNLCPHCFYPMSVYACGKKNDYFYLVIRSDYSDFVNYGESIFVEFKLIGQQIDRFISVTSKEELLIKKEKIKKERGIAWTIWGDKIVMDENFSINLDFFEISVMDSNIYISERLKNEILSNNLKGWEFIPAKNLIIP